MKLKLEYRGQYLLVTGDTVKVKDKLRELGFFWGSETQAWMKKVSREEAGEIAKKLEEFAEVTWVGKFVELQMAKQLRDAMMNLGKKKGFILDSKAVFYNAIKGLNQIVEKLSNFVMLHKIDVEEKKEYLIDVKSEKKRLLFLIRDDEGEIEKFLSTRPLPEEIEKYVASNYKMTKFRLGLRPFLLVSVKDKEVIVDGDTYEVRNTLKQLGFNYNEGKWHLADENASQLAERLKKVFQNCDIVIESEITSSTAKG